MKTSYKIISAMLAVLIIGGTAAFIAVSVNTSNVPSVQTNETGGIQTTDNSKDRTDEGDSNSDIRIPDTEHKQPPAVTPGKPDIDITDMGRNPNAEVVDSQIEYGEKEVTDHEE